MAVLTRTEQSELHRALLASAARLPTDYTTYGGNVARWADDAMAYPDCSCGCRHYGTLAGPLGSDWGVCLKRSGPRFSLLTFEHQAGFQCFEPDEPGAKP